MLQAEEIKLNWEHYRRRVNELFPTRADKLNKMYDDYEERIVMMPASSIAHFHNAYVLPCTWGKVLQPHMVV